MHRRDFLLHAALASAGLTLGTGRLPLPAATVAAAGPQAGPISLASRLALVDALRLASIDQTTPTEARGALIAFQQQAVAADAVPATPAEVVTLLGELRALWPERDDRPHERSGYRGDMAEQRLAWAVGRLGHHAASSVLGQPPAETARRQDAVLLRAFHTAGGARPDVDALADLFRLIDQRVAVRLHTYTPDREDVVDWVPRFVAWEQQRYDDATALAQAVLNAPADTAFLDPDDPAFRLARAVQESRPVAPATLDRLIEAPGASTYAQAVGAAFFAMRGAGQHFAGTLSTADLLARFA
ncbi:MAG: hypothetical protein AAGI71_10540 [Bacteroidota bacterium]